MKIAIAGCSGRMGLTLVHIAREMPGCELVMGGERPGHDLAALRERLSGVSVAELPVTTDPAALVAAADAVIDFTTPEATAVLAGLVAEQGKALVAGTTGLEPAHRKALEEAARRARIVWSANMSLGVTVLEALVERAAALLSDTYDIEVDEMHHRLKKDAPSGTALMLAEAAAKGRSIDFGRQRVHYDEGMIGERRTGSIGMSVRRGGDVVGVHTVTFAGPGENLELTHRAFSRDIYAHGALKAALWTQGKPPGLYTMRDVLGI